ncbi:DUF4369 domain-containing protein [Pontimicrobium sp. IMCC45349]|uniref:DUF4369 domain-containing protein n=1 Tax=Pontimicrobium sp. IMCC45349 TaxID=3391574 RepID=UPI0039A0A324
MKKALFALALVLVIACGKEQSSLTVTGNIKDLKKGTIYLHKIQDTALITIDSTVINGDSNFNLQFDLQEPEVLFLSLDDNSNRANSIAFFADKGVTDIKTSLKRFAYDAVITGSEQQKKLEEFDKGLESYKNQNLESIKAKFLAEKSGDTVEISKANKVANSLLRRKYLYAINFAINNKDSEVAPYIALSEVYDANPKFLDTIYKSLPKNIADSKYGVELKKYLEKVKTQ